MGPYCPKSSAEEFCIVLLLKVRSRDSYKLNSGELEEIFVMIVLVLLFTQLFMDCCTHCISMATFTLVLLQEVVRLKMRVSVSVAGDDQQ